MHMIVGGIKSMEKQMKIIMMITLAFLIITPVMADDLSLAQFDALARFGSAYGIAFQITDDLLDADDPAKQNEMSFLRAVTKERAVAMAEKLAEQAVSALDTAEWAGADGAAAIALLRESALKLVSRTK